MSERFICHPTPIDRLTILERRPIRDERGFLERLYGSEDLVNLIGLRRIEQVNRTSTARCGTLRGLHFQNPPFLEAKLVTCLQGEIFDVALDLRRGSPTFLSWHGVRLSADNDRSLWIPEGFAHGFQTLTEDCELLYLHTAPYRPSAEAGFDSLDPNLGIAWPLPVAARSARDANLPRIDKDFVGITP